MLFLSLQTRKVGLGEDHLAEQTLHKARVPAIGAGQEEPSQTVDGLVAMCAKRHVNEQADALPHSCCLLGKLQHLPTSLDIALLMQSPNQLTVQALQ